MRIEREAIVRVLDCAITVILVGVEIAILVLSALKIVSSVLSTLICVLVLLFALYHLRDSVSRFLRD